MDESLTLPIPISHIENRYLIFDINAIAHLRQHHRICGVFIGTLPQNPSQNVFMGLPMEIMPEEAQLLVDESICYVLDDARAHDIALAKTKASRKRQVRYAAEYESHALEIAKEKAQEKSRDRLRGMMRANVNRAQGQGGEDMGSSTETVTAAGAGASSAVTSVNEDTLESRQELSSTSTLAPDQDPSESLFDATPTATSINPAAANVKTRPQPQSTMTITPTSSALLLPDPQSRPTATSPRTRSTRLPDPPSHPSYTLYKHLNAAGYFQTPGLRFGCQFCVYPGDPLRFHSHFLAVSYEWDEEVDLMDLVGGGRLGTGVKKGWLVGGREKGGVAAVGGSVRTWSVEWAGM